MFCESIIETTGLKVMDFNGKHQMFAQAGKKKEPKKQLLLFLSPDFGFK